MSIALDQPLLSLFKDTTSSADAPSVRSLLVQASATSKKLELVQTLAPSESDKDDFPEHLSNLFSDEPNRSGYVLFRLDSRAANGDWEWLCVAYQPEGAKVREKMQYTVTRTSLLAGLNEQHFLETVYATGPRDFVFPSKLRNSRKHDYQNPQQKAAGKSASEAAGIGAGGARRNFDARSKAAPDATVEARHDAQGPPSSVVSSSTRSPDAVKKDSPPVKNAQTEDAAVAAVTDRALQSAAPLTTLAQSSTAIEEPSAQTESNAADDEVEASFAPSNQGGALPPGTVEDAAIARADADEELGVKAESCPPADDVVAEQAVEESKAPEQPPTRSDVSTHSAPSTHSLSRPLVPDAETIKEHLDAPDAPVSEPQPEVTEAASDRAAVNTSAEARDSSSLNAQHRGSGSGSGTASGGKGDQRSAGDRGSGQSGPPSAPGLPKGPFKLEWSTEAEAALSGLADRVSGSSEHNFVPLATSTSGKFVDVQSPPRFVLPGDMKEAIETETSRDDGEDKLVLCVYRYPVEVDSRKVAFLYSKFPANSSAGPISSTFYTAAVDEIHQRSEKLTGLEIERENSDTSYGPYPRPNDAQAQQVTDRIKSIRYRVEEAAKQCGRSGDLPRLVAVSKLHPPSSIMAAYVQAGQRHFGENYVQELVDKAKVLPDDIRWHFVGGLQSNKGKALASIKNLWCVETLDSIKAANVLEKALASNEDRTAAQAGPLRVYLQVNTSGEDAKSGVKPLLGSDGSDEAASDLVDLATHVITACPNLQFAGLMTIGSASNSRSSSGEHITDRAQALEANPDFAKLDESRRNVVERLRTAKVSPAAGSDVYDWLSESSVAPDACIELSMGMTADFEVAIAAGSANVRIGTACFGERPASREEARKGMEAELAGGAEMESASGPTASSNPQVGEKGFSKPKRPGQKR
ncbi:unnamed protein product [Parajaminaea phylloscopi]